MDSPKNFMSLLVVGLVCAVFITNCVTCEANETTCEQTKAALESHKQQLGEFMAALEKARSDGDQQLVKVLKYKTDELLQEIMKLQKNECVNSVASNEHFGIGPVKSDEAEYASKSCQELNAVIVRMLRKISYLKRRSGSTFSELSFAEQRELDEASRELNIASAACRSRCKDVKAVSNSENRRRSGGPDRTVPLRHLIENR